MSIDENTLNPLIHVKRGASRGSGRFLKLIDSESLIGYIIVLVPQGLLYRHWNIQLKARYNETSKEYI